MLFTLDNLNKFLDSLSTPQTSIYVPMPPTLWYEVDDEINKQKLDEIGSYIKYSYPHKGIRWIRKEPCIEVQYRFPRCSYTEYITYYYATKAMRKRGYKHKMVYSELPRWLKGIVREDTY